MLFLRSRVPATFPRQARIEVAATDGSFQTSLSLADGSLMLEDAGTAVATLDPLARFGPSAFGPVQLRIVSPSGVPGDWIPLGSLIRFPQIDSLRCYRAASRPCTLTGSHLFLITAIGTTPEMANAQQIPPEFAASTLTLSDLPRADGQATLYLHLRDDPQPVQALTLPITLIPLPTRAAAKTERAEHRSAEATDDATPVTTAAATPTAAKTTPAAPPLPSDVSVTASPSTDAQKGQQEQKSQEKQKSLDASHPGSSSTSSSPANSPAQPTTQPN